MSIKWKADPAHTEIQFKVRHLMITNVTGYFRKFDIEVETETEDFSTAKKIIVTADIDSIDTNNEQRDAHLRSSDFFHGEEYRQIRFEGESFEVDGDDATLQGLLTIRGVTKPIKLNVESGGVIVDPYGQTKAGFTVTGKLKRKDYGLKWDAYTETGGVVVSDEIRIHAEVQLVKQVVEELEHSHGDEAVSVPRR